MADSTKNWPERAAPIVEYHAPQSNAGTAHTAPLPPSYQGEGAYQQSAPYRWTSCPEWEQTGRCKYGEMCYRRHGPEDTRIVPHGWEKKRSMRSASQSSHPLLTQSGSQSTAGASASGAGQSQWVPRSTAPKPVLANPSKASTQHGPLHNNSGSTFNYSTQPTGYQTYSTVGHIGSPDSYDSDPPTSPHVLSPAMMSPTVTSPSLSHRMSLSSSPRELYDHQAPVIEKPWIWQPCRHWQDSGSCRYGDSCKYRHGPEDRRERPAPRPSVTHSSTSHPAGLLRSNSNSSMESLSTFSTTDSLTGLSGATSSSRPNISLQPIGTQITSPNASMGTLPPFQPSAGLGSSSNIGSTLAGLGSPQASGMIWDMFAPTLGSASPPLTEHSTAIVQAFGDQIRSLAMHHHESSELQAELNSIHIQTMIAIQLQRESFLPLTVQEPMRVLLQSIAISSNPHEWQFALVRVLELLNALMDHLFNKFVSVSISSPSSSFGQLPVDVPSKLSLIQPYIGGRLSGSITELYDLGQRASAGLFAPTQEEVITILEQLRRIAASTSKSV